MNCARSAAFRWLGSTRLVDAKEIASKIARPGIEVVNLGRIVRARMTAATRDGGVQ
jgi:hypothetical protein